MIGNTIRNIAITFLISKLSLPNFPQTWEMLQYNKYMILDEIQAFCYCHFYVWMLMVIYNCRCVVIYIATQWAHQIWYELVENWKSFPCNIFSHLVRWTPPGPDSLGNGAAEDLVTHPPPPSSLLEDFKVVGFRPTFYQSPMFTTG